MPYEECDSVPARPAPETAKDLLLGAYAERGRLVIVKGAEALEVLADLFKRYIGPDDFHDVGGVKHAVDGLLWDAGHTTAWFTRRFAICVINNWADYPFHGALFTNSQGLSPISLMNRDGTVGSP